MPTTLESPDYDQAVGQFFDEAVHNAMAMQDPIFAELTRRRLPPNSQGATVQAEGREVHSPEVQMSFETQVMTKDVIEGNLERFHEIVFSMARAYLDQFMPALFSHVDDAAEAVGNTISFDNENLSWDDLMDATEKVEWGVDDQGLVRPPQIVAGPELSERISRLSLSDAQRERWVSIYRAKQEQHVSRRRGRKLR
jgi:hypothetical protein